MFRYFYGEAMRRVDSDTQYNYSVTTMKANIVKIGNSKGIRIPKPLLEQCGFEDEVEMEIHNHEIIIRSCRGPREGWEEKFKAMAQHGDDVLLDGATGAATRWDEDEWEWK